MMKTMRDDPQDDCQSEWNPPECDGVRRFEEELERCQVVFEAFFFQSARHFESVRRPV